MQGKLSESKYTITEKFSEKKKKSQDSFLGKRKSLMKSFQRNMNTPIKNKKKLCERM